MASTTHHQVLLGAAEGLDGIDDGSVHLVVTSPPYPMIEMWDDPFGALDPAVPGLLDAADGWAAYRAMHAVLDRTWAGCARVLAPGGFLCVNIGDATRSLGGQFALYPNHARISTALLALGLTPLPDILWRKPTNAPNKFMGSGMLPAGAYVTYEHEYVLVFRKGGKRRFSAKDAVRRRQSAFFWEERNLWFSDLWQGLRGTGQKLGKRGGLRDRSGAFPLELPFRLVQMYSLRGDTVLDPFLGTGTTALAAAMSGRHSVGCEVVSELLPEIAHSLEAAPEVGQARARARLAAHKAFVAERLASGKQLKHHNDGLGMHVMTSQERALELQAATAIRRVEDTRWEVDVEAVVRSP